MLIDNQVSAPRQMFRSQPEHLRFSSSGVARRAMTLSYTSQLSAPGVSGFSAMFLHPHSSANVDAAGPLHLVDSSVLLI